MYNILFADDEKEILEIFKQAFDENKDYNVFYAKDGLEAFQISKKQKLDLIVTDMNMPKVSGGELISALRQQKANSDVPIFILSGHVEKSQAEAKEFEGVTVYTKPFKLDVLMKAIDKSLQQREAQKSRIVDVRFINALIDSTITVLKSFGGCKEIKNLPLRKIKDVTHWPPIDISGVIHLNSDQFNGKIIVSFGKDIFLHITNHILGENLSQISAENNDAAGEIANIILGQSKPKWQRLKATVNNYSVEISSDDLSKLATSLDFPGLFIPFETDLGPFYILISFAVKNPSPLDGTST